MEKEATQTVLLGLVGATPAVLTETVWVLATQADSIIPDRIIALATAPGAALLKEKLFTDGHWKRMTAQLRDRGIPLEGKLKFGPIGDSIRVFPDLTRSRELDDIRSLEDNQATAEFFMEIIRGFTENESVRLIVSIAGGRKTTSALLHSVMTLLGRSQDQINHILINDEWIFQKDFLYPGCTHEFPLSEGVRSSIREGVSRELQGDISKRERQLEDRPGTLEEVASPGGLVKIPEIQPFPIISPDKCHLTWLLISNPFRHLTT